MIPSLLRRPGPFRWFWIGQTGSLFGDQITLVALPLTAVLMLKAGPAEMGYIVAAAWLPYLFFAVPAGAWVDQRRRRRLVMVAADVDRAALLLTIPLAAASHRLTLTQVYAVIFLSGTCSVFFRVAYEALFQAMVPRDGYVEGQSLLNGSRAFSFVGGPAAAGFLVQAFSGPVALVVDAFSFLVSALTLGLIRPAEAEPARRERGHLLSGVRSIFRSPVMRARTTCGRGFPAHTRSSTTECGRSVRSSEARWPARSAFVRRCCWSPSGLYSACYGCCRRRSRGCATFRSSTVRPRRRRSDAQARWNPAGLRSPKPRLRSKAMCAIQARPGASQAGASSRLTATRAAGAQNRCTAL